MEPPPGKFSKRKPLQRFSARFLHWAIKALDPYPDQDGTTLHFAREAFAKNGICEEELCPYPNSSISLHEPSKKAKAAALPRAGVVGMCYHPSFNSGARAVLSNLEVGSPVAITLPVFRDPLLAEGPTNWSTTVGWDYGRVFYPPPSSVISGGDAICIVGFVPDAMEAYGGFFIFRHCWGVNWARSAPVPGISLSPEPGYGEISAAYVNDFVWEVLEMGRPIRYG